MYAFVAGQVRDRATAEDVTSEVLHKALANVPSYDWRGAPFAGWLLRIAANAIVDQAKRAAREFSRPKDRWGSFPRFRSRWCRSDLWSSEVFGRSRSG